MPTHDPAALVSDAPEAVVDQVPPVDPAVAAAALERDVNQVLDRLNTIRHQIDEGRLDRADIADHLAAAADALTQAATDIKEA